MQLVDYINREKGTKELTKKHRSEIFEMKTELRVLSKYRNTEPAQKHVTDTMFNYGLKMAYEGYDLPKLGNVFDGLPKTHTRHARTLADRIGFAIMPLEYLSEGRQWEPPYEQQRHITYLKQHFDLYVMAPVHAYSLSKHIKAETDKPMFVPKDMAQAFTALGMSIPVFRSMQRQINENTDRTNRVYESHDRLKADVAALKARVDGLEEQAVRLRVEREEETRRVKLAEKQREADERSLLAWYADSDPIILCFEEHKTIKDDTLAFIGPCWGTLPARVVEILSLKSTSKRPTPKPKLLPK